MFCRIDSTQKIKFITSEFKSVFYIKSDCSTYFYKTLSKYKLFCPSTHF